jgi:intein-encoded DNA endonuclease-like protein
MVIHEFRGNQNEFQFLKFVAMNAQELQSLHVVLQEENISLTDKVNEIREKLESLQFQTGISGVLLVLPTEGTLSRLQKATDLTFDDPFRF